MEDFLNGYEVVSSAQANALSVLFDVYKHTDACSELEPMIFGHNHLSGYYYIAFENISLSIVLTPWGDVQFMTTDYDNGNEEVFSTEEEAMKHLFTLE
jgi:hypothetical protein